MENKYFDIKTKSILTQSDGFALKDWINGPKTKGFGIHDDGFKVFLEPEAIKASDEYESGDPYNVEENIEGGFHKRRFFATVEMLKGIKLPENAKLLDVGCGKGYITDLIKKNMDSFEITGLDYSISAINFAHKNFNDIEFIVGDAYKIPYVDEYFDVVVCNNLWEHVPDPISLLNGISRVLKPGGYLLISTPSRYRLSNVINILKGKRINFLSTYHVTEYTVGQVYEQLKYGDYKDIKHYSPKINKSTKEKILKSIIGTSIRLFNKNHCLEETVFYMAKKVK